MSRGALLALALVAPLARAGDFASRVVEYRPAPGQRVNNAQFNNPARALGAPVGGGTEQAENSKLVTLGGFGGSITLAFDARVHDDPRNPFGLDAIVFGNAIWIGGDPTVRFAEPGVIEISLDANGNGLADDAWFVVPGSSLPAPPALAHRAQAWDSAAGTPTPPANTSWYPSQSSFPGWPSSYTTSAYELPVEFRTDALANPPASTSAGLEARCGYADFTPVLRLGDLSGADGSLSDNALTDPEDDPAIDPGAFYTSPDDPRTLGVTPGACGGDAFDIAWAVDPLTGAPANLPGFDFIRISTAIDALFGPGGVLGECSAEIGGVADVRPRPPLADLTGDGLVNSADLANLLAAWGPCPGAPAPCFADLTGDGHVNSADLANLLAAWGSPP